MATIKLTAGGKVILKAGKVSCTCCECPEGALLCATASASETKVGFYIRSSGSLFPPYSNKRYLARSQSGGYSRSSTTISSCSFGGSQTMDNAGVISGNLTVSTSGTAPQNCSLSVAGDPILGSGVFAWGDLPESLPGFVANYFRWVNDQGFGCSNQALTVGATASRSASETSVTYTAPGSPFFTGSVTCTVSSEYTDADLIDYMLAAVGTPGTPASCGSIIIASFSLSSDGLTASGKRGDYAFTIPSGATSCYRITWDRVSTPSGGSPSTTPMEYVWDGSATQTPTYSEDVPGDNTATPGTSVAITIENIVYHCTGCT